MRRRLLDQLEQRVPGGIRELVRLVEDVDLVAALRGLEDDAVADLADVVDPALRGRVHLDHVQRGAVRDRHARVARPVRGRRGPLRTVQPLGEDPRQRRLARPARPREEVRLADGAAGDRVLERAHDRLLPDDLGERLRAIFAVEGGHSPIQAVWADRRRRPGRTVARPARTATASAHFVCLSNRTAANANSGRAARSLPRATARVRAATRASTATRPQSCPVRTSTWRRVGAACSTRIHATRAAAATTMSPRSTESGDATATAATATSTSAKKGRIASQPWPTPASETIVAAKFPARIRSIQCRVSKPERSGSALVAIVIAPIETIARTATTSGRRASSGASPSTRDGRVGIR